MIRWALVLPFCVFIAYSVFAAFKYTRMISNIFMGLVYKPSDPTAGCRGAEIAILDSSDNEIAAIYLKHDGSDRVLVFCHESGSSKESWEKYGYFFPALGFHVLSVDFTEKSEAREKNSLSQWPHEEEVEKLVTVIRWIKRAVSSRARVVLFGVSKGADLALAASLRDPAVEAVVTDGLFSMKEIFRDYIRRWGPILVKPNLFGEHYPDWVVNIFSNLGYWHCEKRSKRKFVDVERLLQSKHVPLLMIHGESDDYVPPMHQKFLENLLCKGTARRATTLVSRFVVPDAAHNEAVVRCRDGYEKEIKLFLERVLK